MKSSTNYKKFLPKNTYSDEYIKFITQWRGWYHYRMSQYNKN